MLMSRVICQTNWNTSFYVVFQCVCVCVFITAGPITKLFAGGGGGEWTTVHYQSRITAGPITKVCVCVFITAGPITKLFAGGGGGEWTTCAMIDDEPKPVWMSALVTH